MVTIIVLVIIGTKLRIRFDASLPQFSRFAISVIIDSFFSTQLSQSFTIYVLEICDKFYKREDVRIYHHLAQSNFLNYLYLKIKNRKYITDAS